MHMMDGAVRRYFRAWLDKDIEVVRDTFSDDAVYSESYGPEYRGLSQILQWFKDWNQRGRVLEWSVKRMMETDCTAVAEWYFRYEYDGVTDGFDGVTIADFDENGKIVKLCEFKSESEHCYPYGSVDQ